MKGIIVNTDYGIKRFFEGRENAFKLFKLLSKTIKKFCSPNIEVKNTQISFGEKYKYIWVWLPQKWIQKRSENSITLTIVTDKKIESPRIVKSYHNAGGYWTHHIIIEHSWDIDEEIENLIREAYTFYLKRLENKKQNP